MLEAFAGDHDVEVAGRKAEVLAGNHKVDVRPTRDIGAHVVAGMKERPDGVVIGPASDFEDLGPFEKFGEARPDLGHEFPLLKMRHYLRYIYAALTVA